VPFLFTEAKTLARNVHVMNNVSLPSGLSVAGYQGAIRTPTVGWKAGGQEATQILYQFLELKRDL
jgi:hypothetical protein